MSDLRAALAERLGWTKLNVYEDNQGPPIECGTPPPEIALGKDGEWDVKQRPDTKLPSLSELIKAGEERLTDQQRNTYGTLVARAVIPDDLELPLYGLEYFALINASTETRAQALLETLPTPTA